MTAVDTQGKHTHTHTFKHISNQHPHPPVPLLTLNVTWKKTTADLGNTIKPKKAKKEPIVHFLDTVPFSSEINTNHPNLLNSGIQLTIALTDPDAPSRSNPKWSQICHWIATDVPLTPSSGADDDDNNNNNSDFHILGGGQDHQTLTEIMPYKPPGPPPKTGKHRYVFVALAPRNGTTERLNLSAPGDRQRWGFEGERAGLREWARENGLGVVGEFFFVLVLLLFCFGFEMWSCLRWEWKADGDGS